MANFSSSCVAVKVQGGCSVGWCVRVDGEPFYKGESFAPGLEMDPSVVTLRPFTLASLQTRKKPNMLRPF